MSNYAILRFSASRTLVGALARWWDWSRYNHVDYVFPDGTCYGAQNSGVGENTTEPKRVKYFAVQVSASTNVEAFLLEQRNKPYDWSAIFGLLSRRDWQNPDKWFCSELVAAAINVDTPTFDVEAHKITPSDLMTHPALVEINWMQETQ